MNCKTWFSFHYGTYEPAKLIEHASQLGVKVLALTNINSTADCWDFVYKCQKEGIKPIIGTEVRNEDTFCYVLLAKNNRGLMAIHDFLSTHKQQEMPFPARPSFVEEDVWVIFRYREELLGESFAANELIGLDIPHLTLLAWQKYVEVLPFVHFASGDLSG
ncbi:PHP domain-containing protein [Sphingobacterium sp. T2]|uniref:PHP domain-containing protein n=1 Tax=Sphingobacterium sp. T2 TaxID=1590596 RepID=UPI001E2D76E4|nr:PHP domain-containing protein [Sphingobacterium sp. T2]